MTTPDAATLVSALAPGEIEARSLAIIEAEVPQPRPYEGAQWEVVRRMIHAGADFELLSLVRFHPRAVEAGVTALSRGCLVVTDTEMARKGIPLRRMEPLGCRVQSLMGLPGVAERARQQGLTRAATGMAMLGTELQGAVAVVGNAPTALAMLLAQLEQGGPCPALILGMCVGFVNAAEAKELLMAQERAPFIAIAGRKGGSALAASALNALADMALRQQGRTGEEDV